MRYMYELDYQELDIDKEKFMANLEELRRKDPRYYCYGLEAIFKRLGNLDDGENMASVLDDCKQIYEHGIAEGYGKFIYYSDTFLFFHENDQLIFDYLDDMAWSMKGSEDYSIVDVICEIPNGKDYLEEFIRDPKNGCKRFYNLLVWVYVEGVIISLMEEDSEELLKGAIK